MKRQSLSPIESVALIVIALVICVALMFWADYAEGSEPLPEAIVHIVCESTGFAGSGTLTSPTQVLTANHVIRDRAGGRIIVEFQSGFRAYANILSQDPQRDLALLQIKAVDVRPYLVAINTPAIGDMLYTAGYGASHEPLRMTTGRMLQYVGLDHSRMGEAMEISGAVRKGDSGGPIVNESGYLVGVVARSDYAAVYGTHTVGIRDFFARSRSRSRSQCGPSVQDCPDGQCEVDPQPGTGFNVFPLPQAPEVPVQTEPPIPPVAGKMDARLDAIDARIDLLLTAIESIQSGPPGPVGDQGPAGIQGAEGPAGADGVDAEIDLDDLAGKIMERLPGITFQAAHADGTLDGEPEVVRLGERIVLKHAVTEIPK